MDFLFDEAPIRWLQGLFGTETAAPFRLVSQLGDTWGILLAVAVARWSFGRRPAVLVAVAGGVAAPVWFGLASLFSVPRPAGPGITVLEHIAAGAFPSGHVFHAVVVWGTLAAVTALSAWVPLGIGAVVGVARVVLGVHYVGDVLGALVLAPLLVWMLVGLAGRISLDADAWPAGAWAWAVLGAAAMVLAGLVLGLLDPASVRRWEVLGMACGGPAALGLHFAWKPARAEAPGQIPLTVALLGIVGFGVAGRLLAPAPWLAAFAAAAGFVWALAGPAAVRAARP